MLFRLTLEPKQFRDRGVPKQPWCYAYVVYLVFRDFSPETNGVNKLRHVSGLNSRHTGSIRLFDFQTF